MTDAKSKTEFEPVPAASLASMPRLPKPTAVASFQHRLEKEGMSAADALTFARAVVDPADARRRLERLTPIRVPGGVIFALETSVWGTAIVPYAVNNREASDRHFPAGVKIGSSEAARYRPLRPPTSVDGVARLEIQAEEPDHLIWALDRSSKFLLENNNLTESIGAQGVMQQVTLAVVDVDFAKGAAVSMLASIDGSSRATSAHEVLGITPHQVVFEFPRNERGHRQLIAEILEKLDLPDTEVSAEEVMRLRALQVPARVFVRFEPDAGVPVGFSKAVDSFVHLVHVEPPKPWDIAASLDAKADSVLSELLNQKQITKKRKTYLEGMYTPEEAESRSFPSSLDARALEIVSVISSKRASVYKAVREGVLLLSKRGGQVRREPKAEIAVELALRGMRANLSRADAKGARETLQDVYLRDDIWAAHLKPTHQNPEELRDAALAELGKGGPGKACVRIAALGAYWLSVQRVLREARFFDPDKQKRDPRSPRRVLGDLMKSPWGIHVLHRAIIDGRDQVPVVRVDREGTRQKGVNGKILEADFKWLRGQVVPPGDGKPSGKPSPGSEGGTEDPTLPDRLLLRHLDEVRRAVDHLEDAHAQLRGVKDISGKVIVDHDGLPTETIDDLRRRLEELRTDLAVYGKTWHNRNAEPPRAVEGEEDDESDAVAVDGEVAGK